MNCHPERSEGSEVRRKMQIPRFARDDKVRVNCPYCTVTLRFSAVSPAVEAVMVTVPVFGPVVYCAGAVPSELVITEVATKVPPAPLSVKFTVTPGTPKPLASATFTTKGAASAVFGAAV